jgi:hypothetical protein
MGDEYDETRSLDSEPTWGAKELAGLILEGQDSPFLSPLAKVISYVVESERDAFEEILEEHEDEFRKIGGMVLYEKLLDAIDEMRTRSNTPPKQSLGGFIEQLP